MNKGFTLVEIMISTVILGALGVGFYGVWQTGRSSYFTDNNLLGLQQQARNGLDRMARELRQASASSVVVTIINSTNYRVTFNTPIASGVQYYLNGTQLVRQYPGGTVKTIASDINYLKFTLNSTTLSIEINAGKTYFKSTSFSLIERIQLRNA